jgi:hypothetical protein
MGRDDDHRATDRCRATREPRTTSPGDKCATVRGRDPNGVCNLRTVGGKADCGGFSNFDAGVTPVERELEWLGAGSVGAERRPKVGEQGAFRIDVPKITDSMGTLDASPC